MVKRIGMASLGCPKNQVDAEIMLSALADAGYEITNDETEADAIIVNTCGFIESAKQESIETILELSQLKKTGKLRALIVTGCLAERYREQLRKDLSEVDVAVSIGENGNIVDIVNSALSGATADYFAVNTCLPLEGKRMIINEPYFAYIKIAEGCNNRCTYCAIPQIRGGLRSRPIESILNEAEELAEKGTKELIVVAQDTTRYGEDLCGHSMLPELLTKLSKIQNLRWIRILYAYPDRVTDELLEVMANNEKIVKYIDLPIQHCNGEILRRMNRSGNRETLENTIKKIRNWVPDITIRTTLITGFPGETKKQFEELCEFVREMKFERLGCFAYSAEEGTPASEFEGQVSEKTKQRRQEIIMTEQSHVAEKQAEEKNEKVFLVLVEGYDNYIKNYYGRSEADAPDIDCKVFFTAENRHKPGEFVKVKITGELDMDLLGEEIL